MALFALVYCLVFLHLQRANAAKSSTSLNVGTVLFHSDDERSCWSKEDIALLRSRRILQDVLPLVDSAQVIDEKYIQFLLKYFNRAFSIVEKRAEKDVNTHVVSRALADTIGGYLKYWALPAARYGFYGGVVSYDSAKNLTNYYEDIKDTLLTDGCAWRSPDEYVFKTMKFKIAKPPDLGARQPLADACNNLGFYRIASSDLTVPMPRVNWEYTPHMMMVPIEDNPLVALQAPESAYILYKYYTVVQNCLAAERDTKQKKEFDARFHNWIASDVLPHLQDDTLYVAFGSVLRLLNVSLDWLSYQSYQLYQRKNFPNSNFILTDRHMNRTIECRIDSMMHNLSVFFVSLLILWVGPCIFYFYFKTLRCRGRKTFSDNSDTEPNEKTMLLSCTRDMRRPRRKPSRRCDCYPCEVLYSVKKDGDKHAKSVKSSDGNFSKTSTNYKSKTSELLLKVSRANSVHSVNFEKEVVVNKLSQNNVTKTPILRKHSSEKLELSPRKPINSESPDMELYDLREQDNLREVISYFNKVQTTSDDLQMQKSLSSIVPDDFSPVSDSISRIRIDSLSTIVQKDSRSAQTSTKTDSLITTLRDREVSASVCDLKKEESNKFVSVRSYCDVTKTMDVTPQSAEVTPRDSETQDSSSASRRDQERPSRIPQKRKTTLTQKKH